MRAAATAIPECILLAAISLRSLFVAMASSFELLPQNESAKPEAPSKVRWVTCGVLGAACLLVFAWHVRPGPPIRARAELDEVQELIDDVIVLDRCDPNNPKTKGHFCKPAGLEKDETHGWDVQMLSKCVYLRP